MSMSRVFTVIAAVVIYVPFAYAVLHQAAQMV